MEEQNASAYFTGYKGIAVIWGGLLVAPFAWSLHLITSYALVGWICERGDRAAYDIITVLILLLTGLGGWFAWRIWRTAGAGWPDSADDPVSRSRFLGMSGILLSGFFALVIVAQWVPTLFIGPCAQ